MPAFVERGLGQLGQLIGEIAEEHGFDASEADPTTNSGASWEFSDFQIRAYCWCEGNQKGHKQSCPPNFEVPGFNLEAEWYKDLGRDGSINRLISRIEWRNVLGFCEAQAEREMRDFDFVRRQIKPQVGVRLLNRNFQVMAAKPGLVPHALVLVDWLGEDYMAIRKANDDYDVYQITASSALKHLQTDAEMAIKEDMMKLGEISWAEMGLEIYPNAEHPRAWGNWVSSDIFSKAFFPKPPLID